MTGHVEQVTIEEEMLDERASIVESAQKAAVNAFRAGIGAADIARGEVLTLLEKTQKDVGEILDRFIARGEELESEGRKRIEETIETRRKQVDERVKETSSELDRRIETILHTMNVPTKADIDDLTKKINSLTRKVNDLAKQATK